MDEKVIKEVLNYLDKSGVKFYAACIGVGLMDLNAEQILRYAADKDNFCADTAGVDVETFRQFQFFLNENLQCTAVTGKGKRCLRRAADGTDLKKFQYGVNTLCTYHEKHALKNS